MYSSNNSINFSKENHYKAQYKYFESLFVVIVPLFFIRKDSSERFLT